jgi:hypothetical protein
MFHRSNLKRRFAPVVGALVALAVAAVPAGADAFKFQPGTFVGKSSLDAGKIELKVVRKSSGLFVRHIVVKGSFDCYGYPEDVDVDRYVSGVKVGPRGGFTIPDADVSLRGHYVTRARIEGSLIAKTLSCDSPRKTFGAHL